MEDIVTLMLMTPILFLLLGVLITHRMWCHEMSKHNWVEQQWDDAARPGEKCWKRTCQDCGLAMYLDVDGWCLPAHDEGDDL